jgi:hypothetical protein
MHAEHWMTEGIRGATGTFQRAAREYAEEYAAAAVAAERERCARLVETHDTYGDVVQSWFDLLARKIREGDKNA